jgi:hypothetical protein
MSDLPADLLTSEQAAERLGVPYRTLMHWVENRLVVPFAVGPRKRAPRLWGPEHLERAAALKRLAVSRINRASRWALAEALLAEPDSGCGDYRAGWNDALAAVRKALESEE